MTTQTSPVVGEEGGGAARSSTVTALGRLGKTVLSDNAPTTFTVPILGIDRPLLMNAVLRMHWAVKAQHFRQIKGAVLVSLIYAKVPRHLGRVRVQLHYWPARKPWPDGDALGFFVKACVDALVARGCVDNDTHDLVWHVSPEITDHGPARLWLTVEVL